MPHCLLYLSARTVKEHSQHTIGVEFSSRTVKLGEKRIKLQVRIRVMPLRRETGRMLNGHCGRRDAALGHCRAGEVSVSASWKQISGHHDRSPSRSVTRSYYRGAAGAILVYDITRSAAISTSPHMDTDEPGDAPSIN